MTENDVINSQAFKVINYLIDQKADELKGYMIGFQDRVKIMFRDHEYAPMVRTRIYEEDPKNGGRNFQLPAPCLEFKDLQHYLDTIQRLESEINGLQTFKCRLTGDWDFTKGDTSDMEAIFGEKIEGH
ncbi:MAG TPA: hypothetical protein V6C65_00335 [Allocoleopsis sp.]